FLTFFYSSANSSAHHSFPTRRSSDLDQASLVRRDRLAEVCVDAVHHRPVVAGQAVVRIEERLFRVVRRGLAVSDGAVPRCVRLRSEEHTSELQSRRDLVCRLLLDKKK